MPPGGTVGTCKARLSDVNDVIKTKYPGAGARAVEDVLFTEFTITGGNIK